MADYSDDISRPGVDAPGFVGGRFNRADRLRVNGEAAGELKLRRDSRLLKLDGLEPDFGRDGRLDWTSMDEAGDRETVFLGLDEAGHACYAPVLTGPSYAYPPDRRIWGALMALPANEASLFATARSVIDWHARHGFCAVCGQPTVMEKAGWCRRCPSCGGEHFPRVDPVVIMLAEHDGRVLIGRQPQFPPNNYSALAGYVEPGESIEGAVIRELEEEAGIHAYDVRYMTSQPWPFPSSLMMGCLARTDDPTITLDEEELEDALWVTADDVRGALEGSPNAPFTAPPPLAIAHYLFHRWLAEQ